MALQPQCRDLPARSSRGLRSGLLGCPALGGIPEDAPVGKHLPACDQILEGVARLELNGRIIHLREEEAEAVGDEPSLDGNCSNDLFEDGVDRVDRLLVSAGHFEEFRRQESLLGCGPLERIQIDAPVGKLLLPCDQILEGAAGIELNGRTIHLREGAEARDGDPITGDDCSNDLLEDGVDRQGCLPVTAKLLGELRDQESLVHGVLLLLEPMVYSDPNSGITVQLLIFILTNFL